MESQTVTLILGAIVVLVIVNFLFLDDGDSGPEHGSGRGRGRRNVAVTESMIESVQAVAPGLTTAQIRADLQQTRSVQQTVERYLAGALVMDHEETSGTGAGGTGAGTGADRWRSCSDSVSTANATGAGVAGREGGRKEQEGPFGGLTFDEKKREMIEENRRKLEKKRGCEFGRI